MRRLSFWLVLGLISVVAWPVGAAPSDDAAKHFDRGLVLFKRQKFLEAADAFYEAYRIHPHGDALYNAGMAWEGAGMRAVAATAYARALREGVRPQAEAKVRAHLAALERRLGKVELRMPRGSRIRVDVLVFEGESALIYLEPGSQALVVTLADGSRVSRRVDAVAGDSLNQTIEQPKPPPPPPKPAPTAPAQPPGGSGWRTAGWISLGVAGVATGAAVVFGLGALGARDDFEASGQTDASARARAVRNMHLTNVCWGVAAVGAVGGGVLLLYVAPKLDASQHERAASVTLLSQF